MKTKLSDIIEQARIPDGDLGSETGMLFGAFMLRGPWGGLMVIVSSGPGDGTGWEHVSVSFDKRAPSWREMCWVKDQFFEPDETVVQFHPPKSEYVNCHPHCLHLWKHADYQTTPPKELLA